MSRLILNGKLVEITNGVETVGDLRRSVGGLGSDQLIRVNGSRTERLNDNAPVPRDGDLVSVPPIVKGRR